MNLDELARWLAHEHRLLDMVLFKLIEERHLLAAGESRFLALAAAEVDRAMNRLAEAQLRRSMRVDQTFAELIDGSPEPYRTIFEDLRQDFITLVREIEEVNGQNRLWSEIGAKLAVLLEPETGDLDHPLASHRSMPAMRDFLA